MSNLVLPERCKATVYTVTSELPEGHSAYSSLLVTVEYRGRGTWVILNGGYALGHAGEWDYEPQPSSRTDEWLEEYRWDDLQVALDAAVVAASKVTVRGLNAAGLLAGGWK